MIHDIRQVFLANLEELDWMDEETKERAKEKASLSFWINYCSDLALIFFMFALVIPPGSWKSGGGTFCYKVTQQYYALVFKEDK